MILDDYTNQVTLRVMVPKTEFSHEFLEGMLKRMTVSFHKYGKVRDAYPDKIDAIESLRTRLAMYEADGNTEWLMDVANFAMIEWMAPAHPNAHYDPQDSDTSPGRVGRNRRVSQQPNTHRAWTLPGPRKPESEDET